MMCSWIWVSRKQSALVMCIKEFVMKVTNGLSWKNKFKILCVRKNCDTYGWWCMRNPRVQCGWIWMLGAQMFMEWGYGYCTCETIGRSLRGIVTEVVQQFMYCRHIVWYAVGCECANKTVHWVMCVKEFVMKVTNKWTDYPGKHNSKLFECQKQLSGMGALVES